MSYLLAHLWLARLRLACGRLERVGAAWHPGGTYSLVYQRLEAGWDREPRIIRRELWTVAAAQALVRELRARGPAVRRWPHRHRHIPRLHWLELALEAATLGGIGLLVYLTLLAARVAGFN